MREGRILFDDAELTASGFDLQSLRCQYRCFDRREGDDVTLSYREWVDLKVGTKLNTCLRHIRFQNGSQPGCEFTEVECQKTFPPVSVYVNLHAQVLPQRQEQKANATKAPSVFLFVLDSISHSNWQRNLPKTLNVLRSEYDSFVFSGFTKVGDNSFPNAAAFLTGAHLTRVAISPATDFRKACNDGGT